MKVIHELSDISRFSLMLYYTIVALGFVYTLKRFGFNKLTLFIVLVFWEGLIGYLGKINFLNYNYYKIFIFIYAVFAFGPSIFKKGYKADKFINITFILFSISFWTSFFLNNQSFITIASQYGKKYALPFLFYHGIKNILHNPKKADYLARLLIFILFLQVSFSVLKVIFIGGFAETIVGSISAGGAGSSVVIPILGFFLIWLNKKGDFKRNEWLSVFSLMLIALASMKRAPVFLLPAAILITLVYVQGSIRPVSLLKFIPVAFILFYFGVKTNYTLNPEGSTWGSFNLKYVYNYSMNYYFGTENISEIEESTSGYGASAFIIFSPKSFNFKNSSELLFGRGLEDIVKRIKGKFYGKAYDYEWEGSAGYAVRHIYTLGYVGFIFYLLFGISLIWIINNKKFRIVVLGFFLWEFFLYGSVTLLSNAMAILFIFICIYSINMYQKKYHLHLAPKCTYFNNNSIAL